eukprot:Skav212578  [mRNA]  locus=scaffold125:340009:341358:- [translate_table: standard]
MQDAFAHDKVEQLPFGGTFQLPRRGVAAEDGELERACDELGWMPSSYRDKGMTLNDSAAIAAAQSCMGSSQADGGDDDWSVETITLQQLHALSNRSRSSKTQSKHNSFAEKPPIAPPVAQVPGDEEDVRAILQELLGDWERAHPDIGRRGFAEEALLKKASVAARVQQVMQPAPVSVSPCVGRPHRSFNQSGTRIKQPTFATSSPPLGLGVDLLEVRDNEPATVCASSPVHKLVEPPHLLQRAALAADDDDRYNEEGDGLWPLDTDLPVDRKLHSFGEFHVGSRGSSYLPGKLLQRLPRTFNESMENIAQERREEYGMPRGVTGLGRGFRDSWAPPERVNADWLLSHRLPRTFNGSGSQGDRCGSSPVQTPAGTFIATPTWSESGEFAPRRDDPSSPLYVQATPQRWGDHYQDMSQSALPCQGAHMYHPGFGLLAPDQAAFPQIFGSGK